MPEMEQMHWLGRTAERDAEVSERKRPERRARGGLDLETRRGLWSPGRSRAAAGRAESTARGAQSTAGARPTGLGATDGDEKSLPQDGAAGLEIRVQERRTWMSSK